MRHGDLSGAVSAVRAQVASLPFLRRIAGKVKRALPGGKFPGSPTYWEERYARGGNSGAGSYGKFADFKADVINAIVTENSINSVIEFGCGDGQQLVKANYPSYVGFDVSASAVRLCNEQFVNDYSKSFNLLSAYSGETAEMSLSLDVIYHLIEDDVFEAHMQRLFSSATRFVVIYSSDTDENAGYENSHVKHRKVTSWIGANIDGWALYRHIPNRYPFKGNHTRGSFADFFIFVKEMTGDPKVRND